MKIALVSLDQDWKDKKKNFKKCTESITLATKEKVDCIIFPELTLTGFCLDDSNLVEEIKNSKTLESFEKESNTKNISIIFGSLLSENNQSFNTFCISIPNQKIKVLYKKINVFKQAGEDNLISRGNEIKLFKFQGISFLPSICFDLRFPIHFISLAKNCHASICIANWPQNRISHWHTLLKARAIENQMYMIGVNRIGEDGMGHNYIESSQIYSPTGEIINPYYSSGYIKFYNINFEETKKVRKDFSSISIMNIEPYLKNLSCL